MYTELRDITEYCCIRIDKDGKWFYEDKEIINPNVLQGFWKALRKDPDGRYKIVMEPEVCYVDVEDCPFVVASILGDKENGLVMVLNTSWAYPLQPEKLEIGLDNVLYTTLPNRIRVRFSRPAYYNLALMMDHDENGSIVLNVEGRKYQILSNQN